MRERLPYSICIWTAEHTGVIIIGAVHSAALGQSRRDADRGSHAGGQRRLWAVQLNPCWYQSSDGSPLLGYRINRLSYSSQLLSIFEHRYSMRIKLIARVIYMCLTQLIYSVYITFAYTNTLKENSQTFRKEISRYICQKHMTMFIHWGSTWSL